MYQQHQHLLVYWNMKNGILCASDTLIVYYNATSDVNVFLTNVCQYTVSYKSTVLPIAGIQGNDSGRINCKHITANGTPITASENLEVKGRWTEMQ